MTGLGAMMTGSSPSGERGKPKPPHDNEFFRTPPEVTEALLKVWRPISGWVWEPAVGDGAMAEVLKKDGYRVIPSDLIDRGYPGTMVCDFLQTVAWPGTGRPAIVTNPPFSLSPKFIEHAMGVLGVRELALILKAQFWHTRYGIELHEKYPPRLVLPIGWRVDWAGGGSPVMDVSWNVWSTPALATMHKPLRREPRPKKGAPPA